MAAPRPNTTYMTPSTSPQPASGAAQKPTLLAFHGSGSNATIHTVQLARLTKFLKLHFNIESMEAPFPSAAGPGILPFFEGCGPFKRWIPPTEKLTREAMKRGEASNIMPPEVEVLVRDAVHRIQRGGGKVVGCIGFSQGTRVVAGLLKGVEVRRTVEEAAGKEVDELDWLTFSFGLSICPAYPPPLIPPSATSALKDTSLSPSEQAALLERKIAVPTINVLGTQDEWLWMGKQLVEVCYEVGEGKCEVVEFDIGHYYPVETEDSERIRDWVMQAWKAGGDVEVRR